MPTELFQIVHPATGCARCPKLVNERHTVVWGSGPPQADIMLIGEAPGAREDTEGLPYQGPAGTLLNGMLRDAGLTREKLHVANMLMCRPPMNRDPEPSELENCRPWLIQHVRDVNPKAVILTGRFAINWLFDKALVNQTEGLMYTAWCDWCGKQAHEGHDYTRLALDGAWRNAQDIEDPTVGVVANHHMTRRLVAAVYHPASVLRNPENRDRVVHQLARVNRELALLAD